MILQILTLCRMFENWILVAAGRSIRLFQSQQVSSKLRSKSRGDKLLLNCVETSLCSGVIFKLQIEDDLGNSYFSPVDFFFPNTDNETIDKDFWTSCSLKRRRAGTSKDTLLGIVSWYVLRKQNPQAKKFCYVDSLRHFETACVKGPKKNWPLESLIAVVDIQISNRKLTDSVEYLMHRHSTSSHCLTLSLQSDWAIQQVFSLTSWFRSFFLLPNVGVAQRN